MVGDSKKIVYLHKTYNMNILNEIVKGLADNIMHLFFAYFLIRWIFTPEYILCMPTNDLIMFAILFITGIIKEDK